MNFGGALRGGPGSSSVGAEGGVMACTDPSLSAGVSENAQEKEMTLEEVAKIVRSRGGYSNLAINSKVFLDRCGWTSVGSCLGVFRECKILRIECNALKALSGLEQLTQLRFLYVQNNQLRSIGSALACNEQLDTLDLSANEFQEFIPGEIPPSVTNLYAAGNRLRGRNALAGLMLVPNLQVLDLSRNMISSEEDLDALFGEGSACRSSLRVLYLVGNPIASSSAYRRTIIARLPSLTYLDDQPVDTLERVCSEAWMRGGREAMLQAKIAHAEERKESQRRQVAEMRRMRDNGSNAAVNDPSALLPLITLGPESGDGLGEDSRECTICQEGLAAGESVLMLPCAHHYHALCIRPWLALFKNTCPMCRAPILPRDITMGARAFLAATSAAFSELGLEDRSMVAPRQYSGAEYPAEETQSPSCRGGASFDTDAPSCGARTSAEASTSSGARGAGARARDGLMPSNFNGEVHRLGVDLGDGSSRSNLDIVNKLLMKRWGKRVVKGPAEKAAERAKKDVERGRLLREVAARKAERRARGDPEEEEDGLVRTPEYLVTTLGVIDGEDGKIPLQALRKYKEERAPVKRGANAFKVLLQRGESSSKAEGTDAEPREGSGNASIGPSPSGLPCACLHNSKLADAVDEFARSRVGLGRIEQYATFSRTAKIIRGFPSQIRSCEDLKSEGAGAASLSIVDEFLRRGIIWGDLLH